MYINSQQTVSLIIPDIKKQVRLLTCRLFSWWCTESYLHNNTCVTTCLCYLSRAHLNAASYWYTHTSDCDGRWWVDTRINDGFYTGAFMPIKCTKSAAELPICRQETWHISIIPSNSPRTLAHAMMPLPMRKQKTATECGLQNSLSAEVSRIYGQYSSRLGIICRQQIAVKTLQVFCVFIDM